jgi:5'-3' exonuclease
MENMDTRIKIQCKAHANYLLIDTSYYVFYRYFATLRWFTFQQPKDDETGKPMPVDHDTLHESEGFITAFKKHTQAEFMKLRKKWKVPAENVIFCNDCPRSQIWRHQHYDGYKAGRVLASNFNKSIFPLFYQFLRDERIVSIESDGLEADDMVWIITQKLRELGQSAQSAQSSSQIIIITNDNDYLQMKADGIEIYNVQGKGTDLCTRSMGDPMVDLYMKICTGDKSDNIPPICQKIGVATAEKFARMTPEEREQWIDAKGGECRRQFELNRRIISFSEIPTELIEAVHKKYNIEFL